MRIAVIGAGGFVGTRVLRKLEVLDCVTEVRALDRAAHPAGPKVRWIEGDFADPALRDRALRGADMVIHLAAVLGGAAEADPDLARRVNIDATLDLIEALRGTPARFVFASTIAAYGTPLPDPVTDRTALGPTMLYGAQKVMIEVALANLARRGDLDGAALRPAGVMARDGADGALKSAFLSRLFYAVARGEDITLPVAEDSATWLASVDTVAQNFIEAALHPDLGETRAFTLPALRLTYADLVAALRRRFPGSASAVRYAPEPQMVALFGSAPGLVTETADRLGLSRDRTADELVQNAMEDGR